MALSLFHRWVGTGIPVQEQMISESLESNMSVLTSTVVLEPQPQSRLNHNSSHKGPLDSLAVLIKA